MVVCVPGGMTLAPTRTLVHPHLVSQLRMRISEFVRLTRGKACRSCDPRATVPKSWARSGRAELTQSRFCARAGAEDEASTSDQARIIRRINNLLTSGPGPHEGLGTAGTPRQGKRTRCSRPCFG